MFWICRVYAQSTWDKFVLYIAGSKVVPTSKYLLELSLFVPISRLRLLLGYSHEA